MDKNIFNILKLINFFVYDSDFKVYSIDLLVGLNYGNNSYLLKKGILGKTKTPSLKIYFPIDSIKFEFDEKFLGVPIFPKLNSYYGKLYLKILDIYDNSKIDFIVVSKKKFDSIDTVEKLGFKIINFSFFVDNVKKEIEFKLSQIDKTSFFAFNDIYRLLLLLLLLYKNLKENDDPNFKYIISLFSWLDLKFGRNFVFQGGNIKKGVFEGKARFLDKNNLKISDDIINFFEKGDIILAENTSVSYMKYILKAGGIITMNNNILSHASIVSRELGLPLILGAELLFLKIFDGDIIRINSKNGEVVVLKRFWEYV